MPFALNAPRFSIRQLVESGRVDPTTTSLIVIGDGFDLLNSYRETRLEKPVQDMIDQYQWAATQVHHFADVSSEGDGYGRFSIGGRQAKRIADALVTAYDASHNVLACCTMGISRSGAIVDVAVMMGFSPFSGVLRNGNALVRNEIMRYVRDDRFFDENGVPKHRSTY